MKQSNTLLFADPILNQLVEKYPAPTFQDRSEFLFEDLLDSIVSQQLSIKAANTIYARFKNLFDQNSFPNAKDILAMDDQKMRDAGISFQKISYIKSVADAFVSDLIAIQKIKHMADDEVTQTLTQIRGIGKWTAEMILIFTLNRPDIFSVGDLGIRNAITKLYGITEPKKMIELALTWSPNRSTACWYLWRSLENS